MDVQQHFGTQLTPCIYSKFIIGILSSVWTSPQVPTKVAVSVKAVPRKLAYSIKALADGDENKDLLVGDVFPKAPAS